LPNKKTNKCNSKQIKRGVLHFFINYSIILVKAQYSSRTDLPTRR